MTHPLKHSFFCSLSGGLTSSFVIISLHWCPVIFVAICGEVPPVSCCIGYIRSQVTFLLCIAKWVVPAIRTNVFQSWCVIFWTSKKFICRLTYQSWHSLSLFLLLSLYCNCYYMKRWIKFCTSAVVFLLQSFSMILQSPPLCLYFVHHLCLHWIYS